MNKYTLNFIVVIFMTFALNYANGQTTNFERGYQGGLKNGYCYNKTGVFCKYPVTFLFPMPRMKESSESYQDGYNRGFQVGIDMQRFDNSNNKDDNNRYKNIPNYQTTEYIPPVDLSLLQSVLERKQKLFYARGEWIQNRTDRLFDLNITLLSNLSTRAYSNIESRLTDYCKQLSSGVDFSDENIFNQIKNYLVEIEGSIKNAYTYAISNTNTIIIPIDIGKQNSNGSCLFTVNMNKIISYNLVVNGKKVNPYDYITFSRKTEKLNNIPSDIIYYVYSKLDNSYYFTSENFVSNITSNNTSHEMNFIGSAKTIFIKANTKYHFWIFDEGVSKSDKLDDLGEITYKTTNGSFEAFRVFKDKYSTKKYYVPIRLYNNGVIDEEYPIYSN